MKKTTLVIGCAAALSLGLTGAVPAMAKTVTSAAKAQVFDVYVDTPTGFTFVKMPGGWQYVGAVGQDDLKRLPTKSN